MSLPGILTTPAVGPGEAGSTGNPASWRRARRTLSQGTLSGAHAGSPRARVHQHVPPTAAGSLERLGRDVVSGRSRMPAAEEPPVLSARAGAGAPWRSAVPMGQVWLGGRARSGRPSRSGNGTGPPPSLPTATPAHDEPESDARHMPPEGSWKRDKSPGRRADSGLRF